MDISEMPVRRNAAIEDLPAEIRHAVLDALDYKSLRAMAQASPTFHRQYVQDRRLLLPGSVQKMLGVAAVDACAVYRSKPESFTRERTKESVAEFLEPYQNRLTFATYSISDEALSFEDVEGLLKFHLTVIEPLIQSYANWALGNFATETGLSPHHGPLSATEEARIVRALYRFELCCNLFHSRRNPLSQPFTLSSLDLVRLVFSLYEPWEVEQLVCVHAYARDQFDRVFRAIHSDVKRDHPRFADQSRRVNPHGSFDFDDRCQCPPPPPLRAW